MRSPSLRAVMFGLVAIAGTTSAAVSLASFIPRIDIVDSQCATVYNANIDGCTSDDFQSGATCSAACVEGLVEITEAVSQSCASVDVGETSIIGVFQNGLGVKALCPDATVSTISSVSSTTRAASQTSTRPAVSTTPTTSTSATQDEQPSSTSSGGLVTDPSATLTSATSTVNAPPANTAQPAASSTKKSSAAKTSHAVNNQLSNAHSGGGSPFDVVATGSSPRLRVIDISMATLLAAELLFVAYA